MPIEINGQIYYRTREACTKIGISRATLFRWLKAGILKKSHRDRRGWRVFTEDDLNKIQAEANRIEIEDTSL
jgi:predicted site-specific integrase-resolvase